MYSYMNLHMGRVALHDDLEDTTREVIDELVLHIQHNTRSSRKHDNRVLQIRVCKH